MWKRPSVCRVLLFMNGCSYKPSAYEIAIADYGQVSDCYEDLITHNLQASLLDPHTAKIEVSRPCPGFAPWGSS